MSHPEGEGPVLPHEARERFQKHLADPKHQPKGKDDPRLAVTRDDPVTEGEDE